MIRWLAAAAAAALVATTGCAREIKWTEEVELHDGRVVQVKRRTELTATGFPVQRTGFTKYHELCYPPLGIYWKSKPTYEPDAFDIVDGKAYVRVPVMACTECRLHGYPQDDAIFLTWTGNAWQPVDDKAVARKLRFNLMNRLFDATGDAKGLVTLQQKKQWDFVLYDRMKRTGRSYPYNPGACARCQESGSTFDGPAPDVLLPPSKCNW